ncbi:Putative sensor-like histidine kinase YfhK [hydrothermal vent metagenome]|uniref:histidine kinase n=1 Tax=hydrothermal vent metagenome TaxID=652676 RepID=A0A3B0YWA7_9ZZZZ
MRKYPRFDYHPKSFFNLLLIAFVLITLPLAVALVNMGLYLDQMFTKSESTVYRSAQVAMVSRVLTNQIIVLERNARQYQVLKDENLLIAYKSRRNQFHRTAEELSNLFDTEFLKNQVATLSRKENILFEFLRTNNVSEEAFNPEEEYVGLSQLAESILSDSQAWINSQVDDLATMTKDAETALFWQAVALAPGTLAFAILLSSILSKPVRQIDQAIRQLGEGELNQDVVVTGPKDLQRIGDRLNWLRHRLADLEHKKGNFVRHVSHELKTPLTAVKEGSSLLAENLLGKLNSQQHEVAQVIQRNALLLQKMIENLLSFNMLETGTASLNISLVSMDGIVENVLADHNLALLAKNIEVKLECDSIQLTGDAEKLRIVVDNLISNAIKYSPEQSPLLIQLRKEGNKLLLDVKDRGPGISPGDGERVFESFYRGNVTPHGDIRGSGLGLSIARELVNIHQGTIEVIPDAGSGAHFRVTLPMSLNRVMA